MNNPIDKGEIIIYQSDNKSTQLEVRIDEETIWLTQVQIVTLFSTSKANVSEHIKQIYQSKELEAKATVRNFRIVQVEGSRRVYHIGASLKDLGKKWFAFSKIELDAMEIIKKLIL
jgi:hypothetical protein